jgi:hypothetical protein
MQQSTLPFPQPLIAVESRASSRWERSYRGPAEAGLKVLITTSNGQSFCVLDSRMESWQPRIAFQ